MRTIYKYPLETKDKQTVLIPGLIKVLCVDVQNGRPCMWCIVDPDEIVKAYTVTIHGTGHEATDTADLQYAGSYQLFDGMFVGHVFIEQKLED